MAQEDTDYDLSQQQRLVANSHVAIDSLPNYLGKRVVIEEMVGDGIFTGDFVEYDGRFLTFDDFRSHETSISNYLTNDNPNYDLESEKLVKFRIPRRSLHVDSISSIQTLDDLTKAKREKLK